VVAVEAVPKKISEARIADYLVHHLEGADKTCSWFEQVLRMPPAHLGMLSVKGFERHRYWQMDAATELKLSSDEEYTGAFEEMFNAAVRVRLRCHKPVASMLTGLRSW
jgi:asparagine synthase (glutamine-hydrolysing)